MVPAVKTAMSSSIALRRSPNPGLTAATLRPPQFVDNKGRQGFSLYVFGNDEQWLAGLDDGLEDWEQRLK